jgi:putative flippase GtrA
MEKLSLKTLVAYIKNNFGLVLRYAVSGFSGVVANLIVFTLLVEWLAVWYISAALIGFVAAYLVTFSLHKWWTFDATTPDRTAFQSVLYLASALGTLVINTALLYVFVELFAITPVVAQFISLGISAVLSFVFTSQVTFHADEQRWQKIVRVCTDRYVSKQWFVPVVLLVVLVLFAGVRLSIVPLTFSSDAVGFVKTAQYIVGDEGGSFEGSRFLKPAAPAVVASISSVAHISYPTALLTQAFLGFIALGLAAYWFGVVFWGDRRAGFVYAIIIVTAYPIVKYGLDNYIETGAWALYFVALAAMLRWYKSPETTWLWLTAGALLLGLLWKEYAALAGLVFGLVILFQPRLSVSAKVWSVLQGFSLTLLPWGIWQAYVYNAYNYTYLDWLAMGTAEEFYQATYTLLAVTKSLAGLLLLVWVFVLVGLLQFRKLSKTQKQFVWFLLVPSFGFLLWGWVSTRLFFSLVPLAAIFATVGLRRLVAFRYQVAVLVFIGVFNMTVVWWSSNPDARAILNNFAYDNNQAIEQSN